MSFGLKTFAFMTFVAILYYRILTWRRKKIIQKQTRTDWVLSWSDRPFKSSHGYFILYRDWCCEYIMLLVKMSEISWFINRHIVCPSVNSVVCFWTSPLQVGRHSFSQVLSYYKISRTINLVEYLGIVLFVRFTSCNIVILSMLSNYLL